MTGLSRSFVATDLSTLRAIVGRRFWLLWTPLKLLWWIAIGSDVFAVAIWHRLMFVPSLKEGLNASTTCLRISFPFTVCVVVAVVVCGVPVNVTFGNLIGGGFSVSLGSENPASISCLITTETGALRFWATCFCENRVYSDSSTRRTLTWITGFVSSTSFFIATFSVNLRVSSISDLGAPYLKIHKINRNYRTKKSNFGYFCSCKKITVASVGCGCYFSNYGLHIAKRAIHRESGRSLEYFGIGPGALLNGKYKLLFLIWFLTALACEKIECSAEFTRAKRLWVWVFKDPRFN